MSPIFVHFFTFVTTAMNEVFVNTKSAVMVPGAIWYCTRAAIYPTASCGLHFRTQQSAKECSLICPKCYLHSTIYKPAMIYASTPGFSELHLQSFVNIDFGTFCNNLEQTDQALWSRCSKNKCFCSSLVIV